MTNHSESTSVTPAQAVSLYKAILRHSEEAWQKWIELGHWIIARQVRAAEEAGSAKGPTYAAKLQKAMGKFFPIYRKLSDNGTMTNLMKCLANYDAIVAFRDSLEEDHRPSHPQRMWKAYEDQQLSGDIDIIGDMDAEGEEGETEPKESKPRKKSQNRERELLAEIELLREKLDEHAMTIDAKMNAERMFRRCVELVGHGPRAAKLAISTGTELVAIGERISDESDGWEEQAPAPH